jgi:hypothetical protein
MDMSIIMAILSAAAAISGIALGWTGRNKTLRAEVRQEAGSGAVLRSDMDYIKRGVDDIRLEQRAQGQRIDVLSERVTRLEESSKQAHRRLDRMEGVRMKEEESPICKPYSI